jgi:hypothetical protein
VNGRRSLRNSTRPQPTCHRPIHRQQRPNPNQCPFARR